MDMKLTTGILAITLMAGGFAATKVVAQNPDAIDNARSVAKSLQQKQANDSNAALDAAGVGQSAKPAPGAPAPAIKPAVIPGSAQAESQPAAKPVSKPAAKTAVAVKTATTSSSNNHLQHVNVVPGDGGLQIELNSTEAVTPRVSKLSSPARILVELPGTVAATTQNRISVGSAGVKGVRIGTDGKTPPTTSVVIDLEKAIAYELTPGAAGKLVLTLHTEGVVASAKPASSKGSAAKISVATSKTPAQVQTAAVSGPSTAKLSTAKASSASVPASKAAVAKPVVVAKSGTGATAKATIAAEPAAKQVPAPPAVKAAAAETAKTADTKAQSKAEDKKWAMNGKRDPFFSPVVQQSTGSGCSTGKKCLEIGNINLRGVVKSDSGFIAVVTNNLNKAYFLRENDPVFNGYVVKITGDSVVFQETVADKLGKPFTREVVKRIFTPAV
jgi:Tfp pilus assembly protein PilP